MKKLILSLLFFISACSSIAENKKSKLLTLNELWEKHSTKSEVLNSLGNGFKEVDSGIVYTYPNSDRPEIGLFFSSFKLTSFHQISHSSFDGSTGLDSSGLT